MADDDRGREPVRGERVAGAWRENRNIDLPRKKTEYVSRNKNLRLLKITCFRAKITNGLRSDTTDESQVLG